MKTKYDARKSRKKSGKNVNSIQDVHHEGSNISKSDRSLSHKNIISSSSGKKINSSPEIVEINIAKKPINTKQRKNPGVISRRDKIIRRRRSKKNDSVSRYSQSEITGLFPYLLNSIRESKSPEEEFYFNCFPLRPHKLGKKLGSSSRLGKAQPQIVNRIIYTLNLPENQIPQISDNEPHFIPSVSPFVIFGQKNDPTEIQVLTIDDVSKINITKEEIGNEPLYSMKQERKPPKQLIPISKMLKEKSGLGPEIIDLDQSLHGLRIRDFESDGSIWSARNSVRELLTEVIGPYKIPSKSPRKLPVIKPKIKQKQIKNDPVEEKPEKKLKSILKAPTPRFYYDRMKDNPDDSMVHDIKQIKNMENIKEITPIPYKITTTDLTDSWNRWETPSNHLSERRIHVDKLIEGIGDG
uniref:Uncharacterized protein n=1 Tax=Pithovirus LCPAC202 TaxID=2506592 RepID=A0A481Z951_9VIRU|nr:MAG: hypothetical protein LCPAC202_01850 [Pithovirus LCPAC202]